MKYVYTVELQAAGRLGGLSEKRVVKKETVKRQRFFSAGGNMALTFGWIAWFFLYAH